MPRVHAAIPVLRIFDEAKALEFYVGFLGFQLVWRNGEAGAPVYLQVSLGDCSLQLSEHFGDGTPGSHVKIRTQELAAFHAQLLAKRYRHAKPELLEQTWGEREMPISDPFDNKLIFWEPWPARSV